MRPLAVVLGVLLLAACEHSDPFTVVPPDPLGPLTQQIPRRLTYNPGDDRSPAGDSVVIYSRYHQVDPYPGPRRADRGHCLAVLPAVGGTVRALRCPPSPSVADTFVSSWREPVLSPDGRQVAFLWVRFARVSVLAAWSNHVVVAPADDPAGTTHAVLLFGLLSGDRRYNSLIEPNWLGDSAVRFLAALDSIFKLKGGGPARDADTMLIPRAIMELELPSGTLRVVPGGDSAVAYSPASDGGTWLAKSAAPAVLLHLASDALQPIPVAVFSGPVTDLAEVGPWVVAAVPGRGIVEWIDPVSGARGLLQPPAPVRRISWGGARRVVAEVQGPMDAFGFPGPADLWLFEVP